jgi:uncharacterized protein
VFDRDGYPPGVPCWVDTDQPDPKAAVAFYRGLFGWEFEDAMPRDSAATYVVARLRGGDVAAIASPAQGGQPTAMWNTHVWVESADDAAARVLDAGGRLLRSPVDLADVARIAVCTDPEGAAFRVWQAREHKGARIVNQPGSLNFNSLSSRDARAAQRFYGAVFGWDTIGLDGGAMAWTLAGYGDYVRQHDPGLRARMAQAGVPEGFEDVVALLTPIATDQPDVPAHWTVTFAVDDADVTAERATELGGHVVMAPFDAPFARMTVIADPQGATFIASQFVPQTRPADADR